ncbi:hypothetical protein ACNQF7_10510 [Flavobacterium sp. RSP29]|uniref:hypothetical protein n=1 Tax=Flavobacterium sp. RSP29 TaxID=3401731 RepID=UPI003AABB909
MNQLVIKIAISLVAMIVLLVMALTTHDVINSKVFASFAIILGAYSSSRYQIKTTKIMNRIENLTLIEGDFSEVEAREVLIPIFSSKINFHKIKNWSSQERFGEDDEIAQKRIPELKNEIEKLQKILSEAKAKNKRLLVSSQINISLIDN